MAAALRVAARYRQFTGIQSGRTVTVEELVSRLAGLVAANRVFTTIFAHPSWPSAEVRRTAGKRLFRELLKEPVAQIAADDAHLHLWTPNAYVREALELIAEWDFEYASTFVCISPLLARPLYWKGELHFLLLGVRGKLPFCDRDVSGFSRANHALHRPPKEIVPLIERVSRGPYLEIFGDTMPTETAGSRGTRSRAGWRTCTSLAWD